jgi:hypothetical protein
MVVKANIAFQKPARMNVLYVGVDNPITVYAPNVAVSKLYVKMVRNDSVTILLRSADESYTVNPTTAGFCQIDIYDGARIINSQRYSCKNIPAPIATIGGKYVGGNLTPGNLKAQMGVIAVLENFDFDARISIEGYTMTYISKGEKYTATQSGNPTFSPQMKSYIDRAANNDVFILGDIKIKFPNGQTTTLPAISLIIVEGK